MIIDLTIAGLAVVTVALMQVSHHKKHDEKVKALITFFMQNQRAIGSPSLRRLYVQALKDGSHRALHYWLNQTQGDIRIGHIWLVRQYVLNRKNLPYPVPSFHSEKA